jgi:hypothetical protein
MGVDGLKAALGETVRDNNDVFLALQGMCVGFDAYVTLHNLARGLAHAVVVDQDYSEVVARFTRNTDQLTMSGATMVVVLDNPTRSYGPKQNLRQPLRDGGVVQHVRRQRAQ